MAFMISTVDVAKIRGVDECHRGILAKMVN